MVVECKLAFLFCPSANGLWPGSQPQGTLCTLHSVIVWVPGSRASLTVSRRTPLYKFDYLSSHHLCYVRQPVNLAQQGDQQLSPSH